MTVEAILGMTHGFGAISAITVDLADMSRHFVVPAAKLGAFGCEITHRDDRKKS